MNTPTQLKARFPYQFEGKHLGLSFAKGWFPAFTKLCADIDAALGEDKQGFQWDQIKEKFGWARYYYLCDLDGKPPTRFDLFSESGLTLAAAAGKSKDPIFTEINRLIDEAETATKHTCIHCGKPGANSNQKGYYLVECEHHRGVDSRVSPYFEDGES